MREPVRNALMLGVIGVAIVGGVTLDTHYRCKEVANTVATSVVELVGGDILGPVGSVELAEEQIVVTRGGINRYRLHDIEKQKHEAEERERKEEVLRKVELEMKMQRGEYKAFGVSGYAAKEYDVILRNTPMAGMGTKIEKVEKEYGVNGMFILGVARAETTFGKATPNVNNLFCFRNIGGVGYQYKATKEKAVEDFCKLMNKPKYKGKSIEEIGSIYAEGDAWSSNVKEMMRCNLNWLNERKS